MNVLSTINPAQPFDTAVFAAMEIEQAVIGLLLSNPDLLLSEHRIEPDHCIEALNGRLIQVLKPYASAGEKPVLPAIALQLANDPAFREVGGRDYLATLIEKSPHRNRWGPFARAMLENWRQRRTAELANAITEAITHQIDPSTALAEFDAFRATNRNSRFSLEFIQDIRPAEIEWLVSDLLPLQGVGFIAGPSGSGKSFIALDWSLSLAQGLSILNKQSHRCGVLYIASEGASGVRKRVKCWQSRFSSLSDDAPFAMIGDAPDLRQESDTKAIAVAAKSAADRFKGLGARLGLIVIDTMSQSMPGANENDSSDMSQVMARVAGLAKDTGAFVLVVHHTGKDQERGLRGHSLIRGAIDLYVELSHKEGEAIRVGTVKKLKDGEDGERFAFGLEPVEAKCGDLTVKSCVPQYQDAFPVDEKRTRASSGRLNAYADISLKALLQVWDNSRNKMPAPSEPGVKEGQLAIPKSDVKDVAVGMGLASDEENSETIRKRFDRALADLVRAGKIRISGKLLWPL